MLSTSRTLLGAAVVLSSTLLLSGCAASDSADSHSATAAATATEITSSPLLDKSATDVLDQVLKYPSASAAQVSSSIITIPIGMETGLHKHDAPMYAFVLEGELTVTYDGGVVKTYHAGEAIMEAVGTPHNGKNTGTTPVKVLVVNMGADGVANTVKLP